MTMTPERRTATLTELVAQEIDAARGRRRMSQAQLARAMGKTPMWVSLRLRGLQPIDLNDLLLFARALGVEVHDLMPSREAASGAVAGAEVKRPYISAGHRPDPLARDPLANRPIGGGRYDGRGPRSTPHANRTRPGNSRPAVLPRAS